ncbi:phytoene desaturase [candidate division KSB1 bacterium]|nr:phytoene desaturase [candidate division KSB1 bacterium]
MNQTKKAIIIGSGFGGLALGIRLQARGFDVTIFEKNEKSGGHAYPLDINGYKFDMGPSLITAPDIIQDIFRAANRKMEDYLKLIPLDPYYRIYFHDGTYIDYQGDTRAMKDQMAKFNSEDAENYERFIAYAGKLHDAVINKGLGKRPFTWKAFLKFIPKAMKLWVPLPSYYAVKRFFKDFRNIFTFSFNTLFIGGNPFRTPSVYLMIPYLEKSGGVWYTMGGMYSFVEALETLFLELGGKIQTNSEVTEIVVENKTARGVNTGDQFYQADIVISNAHFAHTQLDLIKPEHRSKWNDRRVKKMSYSMSAFILYIGSRKKYPKLRHHTLIIAKRYRDLIYDIFERKILADDFSIYAHVPSRTDPGMAPNDGESMYFLIPVPNLAGHIDWEKAKHPFAEKVLNFLEYEFGLENLRDSIEVSKIITPLDFEKHANNYLGSAWGLEPKLTQTASFRPQNRSEDIKNLYLVGTSTHPGAGIPGTLLTSEATEYAIMNDFQHVG